MNDLGQIVGKNFQNYVNYDYDTLNSCEESGCDSICRCGVIVDQRITRFDISKLTDEIYDSYFDRSKQQVRDEKINSILYGVGRELNIYCIDRILRHYKIWDNDTWYIDVVGGYYGQEIGSVTIDSMFSSKIQSDIETVLQLNTSKEKIEFLLNLEYGFILPELDECDYEIVGIRLSDIKFGNDKHFNKIKSENLDHYIGNNYNGIRGVVSKNGDTYRVVDGYHRIYAAGEYKSDNEIIRIILVKK